MMWLKRQMDRDAGFPDITQNPVGTSQLRPQVLTNPDPNVSPVVPRDLLSWQGLGATRGPVTADTAAQNTARALMGMDMALGFAGQATPVKGIKAYHGSPHSFDRFDMSKIGTGEGAQAYGHGLYFAGNEGVARGYRDTLSGGNVDARNFFRNGEILPDIGSVWQQGFDAVKGVAPIPNDHARAIATQIQDWVGSGKKASTFLRYNEVPKEYEAAYRAAMAPWQGVTYKVNPGHMYEVNLNVDPTRLLDWDKPLAQQSQAVRDLARDAVPSLRPDLARAIRKETAPGADVYKALEAVNFGSGHGLSSNNPGQVAASTSLRDAGVPGIRYLDAGSRGAGEGTHNYVMFDDKLIDILRKYGLFGLGLTGAAGEAAQQFAPQQAP